MIPPKIPEIVMASAVQVAAGTYNVGRPSVADLIPPLLTHMGMTDVDWQRARCFSMIDYFYDCDLLPVGA